MNYTLGVDVEEGLGGVDVDDGLGGVDVEDGLGGVEVDEGLADVDGFGVEVGGLTVELGFLVGGYRVVQTVVLVVVVSREVYVDVRTAVPPFKMLLQNSNASEVWPMKASRPH